MEVESSEASSSQQLNEQEIAAYIKKKADEIKDKSEAQLEKLLADKENMLMNLED